jgi:hypothetical protein
LFYLFVFVLGLVLPDSLDCPSVFTNVYLQTSLTLMSTLCVAEWLINDF